MNRRDFLTVSASASSTLLLPKAVHAGSGDIGQMPIEPVNTPAVSRELPDLRPARWIWYPSGRTLPSTFILFHRELELDAAPRRATGWICADSRYRLGLNGSRVQWGPAPSDPRWTEADPLDLTAHLHSGKNVLGVTVLFYGSGDGTSPLGRPGFLFWLKIEHANGRIETIVSDAKWRTLLCRAWSPGRPKRWYLRALQEEFDARLYPYGWDRPGFRFDEGWLSAMELDGSPNQPSISTDYPQYLLDPDRGPSDAQLRPRSIPFIRESVVSVSRLSESYRIHWDQTPENYFDFRVPGAFRAERAEVAVESSPGEWRVNLNDEQAAALTFELSEQIVGWPGFTIEAPAGTVIELLVQEAHALGGPPLLNTHFDSWTRFICREGINDFETFEFESLRWMQLHIRKATGVARLRNLYVRRRSFPWPHQPAIRCSDPQLLRLFSASINTLANCAQETLVDGMGRERQQYSGDGGHQIHALHLACGETAQVARYLATWSQGLAKEGFFLDCWPAYDRLARLEERQLDLTPWGPLLDHGVGFNFDCWSHYLYTGDLEPLREPYPRLLRFAGYLQTLVRSDGLLPVEDFGIPAVWIDHIAYQQQRHKKCAFNLYAAAAMEHALSPLCRAFGDVSRAEAARQFGLNLLRASVNEYWSPQHGKFINNLPWLSEEPGPRTCDRSLANSILFDQCPGGQSAPALQALVDCPPEMGFSYPANACWRLWALAKSGRGDVIVADLRHRWAVMESVKLNNTLQEDWHAEPDSTQQWSHCAVVPLYIAFHGLMGLRALEPGFKRYQIRPQLGDLEDLELTAFTIQGAITLTAKRTSGGHELVVYLPPRGDGELILPRNGAADLHESTSPAPAGHRRYLLPPGGTVRLTLPISQ